MRIYKVKRPKKPIQIYTTTSLKKSEPELYEQIVPNGIKCGDKRVIQLSRNRSRPLKVGVHWVHPREMSVKARKKICGKGLRGECRRLFIEEGMTMEEQRLEGRKKAADMMARALEQYREDHPEEFARKQAAQRERTATRRQEQGGIDYSKFYSPKHLSKAAGIPASDIRKFLRKKKVGKRGGRYAFTKKEAMKVARAAKRYYKEES